MKEIKPGDFIIYLPTKEKGRVKSINSLENGTQVAFVVYKCNNDWDNYKDYTACATNLYNLIKE